jgi:HAE1 family hydrophobic/amphiphilic exporter-1
LDRIFMKGTGGVNIALASVAELVMGTSPVTINRENQARTLTITAAAARGVAPNAASELAARLVKEQVILPEGITVVSDSDYDDVLKMVPTLVAIIVMAVTMVYAIMAAQFESLKGPFVIISTLLTVPIGPVLIHILSGRNFSTLSAIGFVLLVGIVVNNGIILVDYTNLLRLRGRSLYDAIVEGAGSRLRPILMTSLTTILGMIPMAFFPGEGGAFTSPIGVTVLGGMISSTFMTLFLVPPLYAIIYRDDRKDRALASGRNSVKEKKSGRPSDNFNEEEF